MPIAICSKCNKPIPDSYHSFEDPCRCRDWVEKFREKGWKINEETKKALEESE